VGGIERVSSDPWEARSAHRFGTASANSGRKNLRRDGAKVQPKSTADPAVKSVAASEDILAGFRRHRAGDRGLIAAPWTPLASLCLPFRRKV